MKYWINTLRVKLYETPPAYRLLIALVLSCLLHLILLIPNTSVKERSAQDKVLQVKLENPADAVIKTLEIPDYLEPDAKPALTPHLSESERSKLPNTGIAIENAPSSSITSLPSGPSQQTIDRLLDSSGPIGSMEIEFELFAEDTNTPKGKAIQHFEADTEGNYYLSFKSKEAEATSQDAKPEWELHISGVITKYGLRPSRYLSRGDLAQTIMGVKGVTNTEDGSLDGIMPDGLLDRVSLIYQFMHIQLADDGELYLTNGKKVSSFNYRNIGSESLEVKQHGVIQTQHIIFSDIETLEVIEVWLASDFRNLPIKVRYTNGDVTIEQIASSISVN